MRALCRAYISIQEACNRIIVWADGLGSGHRKKATETPYKEEQTTRTKDTTTKREERRAVNREKRKNRIRVKAQ